MIHELTIEKYAMTEVHLKNPSRMILVTFMMREQTNGHFIYAQLIKLNPIISHIT